MITDHKFGVIVLIIDGSRFGVERGGLGLSWIVLQYGLRIPLHHMKYSTSPLHNPFSEMTFSLNSRCPRTLFQDWNLYAAGNDIRLLITTNKAKGSRSLGHSSTLISYLVTLLSLSLGINPHYMSTSL